MNARDDQRADRDAGHEPDDNRQQAAAKWEGRGVIAGTEKGLSPARRRRGTDASTRGRRDGPAATQQVRNHADSTYLPRLPAIMSSSHTSSVIRHPSPIPHP